MSKLYVPISFNTDELLQQAKEIQDLAEELGRKVHNFRVRAIAKESASSETNSEEAEEII